MSWIRRWPGSSSGSPCWTAVWTRKNQQRVQEISDEVEQLSLLVEDVLSFMRSEAIPESPARRRPYPSAPLLQYVTRREAGTATCA